MKRTCWLLIFAAALLLCLPVMAQAEETTILSADTVRACAGETVTVPIRLEGNPGFTNFAVSLEYDKDKLTLVRLNARDEDGNAHLCGTLNGNNPEWETEEEAIGGYLTGASAEVVTGDGIFFTATFQLAEDFSGSATVKPVLHYLRKAGEAGFADIPVTVKAGSVNSYIPGDVDDDGEVTLADAMMTYNASIGLIEENDRMDIDQDGEITLNDAMRIYNLSLGGA